MGSQAKNRAWRRLAASLLLVPAMAGGSTLPAQPAAAVKPAADKPSAQGYLKEGRRLLLAGDSAAARQFALAAQQSKVKWDFWQEDTPEKLLADIAAGATKPTATDGGAPALTPIGEVAEAPKEKVNYPNDARALVKMGRDYLKAGKIELAEECGKRASVIPMRWGVFEFTAEKLMGQVAEAKAKRPRSSAMAKANAPVGMPARSGLPDSVAMAAKPVNERPTGVKPGMKKDELLGPPPGSESIVAVKATETVPAANGRAKAVALMAECRTLEKANRLTDARNKAVEAQKLGVDWQPGDDRPEAAMMDLAQKAAGQINGYVEQAMQMAGPTPSPEKAAQAVQMLAQSKQFAETMGFDSSAIAAKMEWVRTAGGGKPSAPTPVNKSSAGREMLAKANLELKSGQPETARKLAEAVYAEYPDLKSDAAAMLRSIEVEARNRNIVKANEAYDAAVAAMGRGDASKAAAIFGQIDGSLLSADKQRAMKSQTIEAQSLASTQVQRVGNPPGSLMPPAETAGNPNAAGRARAGDPSRTVIPGTPIATPMPAPSTAGGADSFANQTRALQQVEFQRLRSEGLKVQREAQSRFSRGETDAAIGLLQDLLSKLKEAKLEATDLSMLQRPVEYRLQSFKVLKAQRDLELSFATRGDKKAKQFADENARREAKYKTVSELMKQFHQLMEEKKYEDAEVLALKAQELDPDSEVVSASVNIAKMAKRKFNYDKIKSDKEELVLGALNDAEKQGPALSIEDPIRFDLERARNSQNRGRGDREVGRQLRTERERDIERKLSTPVTVDFNNTPVRETVKYLQKYLKMNIVMDSADEMKQEGLNPEAAVSLTVEAVPLKSVLNLILKQAKMTYIVSDDVLQVVSEKRARGKLKQIIYPVADLVVPIDNYTMPNSLNLPKLLDQHNMRSAMPFNQTGSAGFNPANGLPGGNAAGTSSMSTVPGGSGNPTIGGLLPAGPMSSTGNVSLAKNTIEDVLIKLVTNTVAPHTWSEVGGAGKIDYYPIGMAMVVNQFEDVQEQIADLLDQLRRLQDLEVAIEVRIVSVSETFFERIGMDFSLNIKTDAHTKSFEPQLTTGAFKPAGFLNDPRPQNVVSGLTPAGTLTPDLDIPIRSNSFNMSIPPFAYPNSPGGNGGLSLGLAFLNDIQVFMFMEAAQGDRRFNVMQAPKLTAFNGASANISLADIQFFVTDLQVFNVNGQIIFRPVNTPFPTAPGTPSVFLFIQPVVSADRRYVRLNMQPQLYTLSSATVPLFPVTAFITPTFEGGFVGQPIPFTQFIQQPAFNLISVQTTVSVPDGGTVVLGGLKTLSEGRNEFGPPVLSKIPYLNRLFRNTGYGREAQSTLILVTPRIIINREEAERQVGEPQDFNVPGAGAP